ncbi:hypothetical protein MXD63_40525, partial [Frankia sp. Cpl3]|nr:hypothetical protein [Frankia sp. Cpl3]
LISTGLVIFGTLFVGLFVIELYQAKNSGSELGSVTVGEATNKSEPLKTEQNEPATSVNQGQGAEASANQTQAPAASVEKSSSGSGSSQTAASVPGQKPSPAANGSAISAGASKQGAPSPKPKAVRYVVQKGDTL